MSQDRKLEALVSYEAFKKTDKIFLTLTDKLDVLKTQLKQGQCGIAVAHYMIHMNWSLLIITST